MNKSFLLKANEDSKLKSKKDKASDKKRRSVSEIKQLILDLLSENEVLSKADLVKKMSYAKLTDTVSKAIGELIAEQKIKYTENKLNSKNQKLSLSK